MAQVTLNDHHTSKRVKSRNYGWIALPIMGGKSWCATGLSTSTLDCTYIAGLNTIQTFFTVHLKFVSLLIQDTRVRIDSHPFLYGAVTPESGLILELNWFFFPSALSLFLDRYPSWTSGGTIAHPPIKGKENRLCVVLWMSKFRLTLAAPRSSQMTAFFTITSNWRLPLDQFSARCIEICFEIYY